MTAVATRASRMVVRAADATAARGLASSIHSVTRTVRVAESALTRHNSSRAAARSARARWMRSAVAASSTAGHRQDALDSTTSVAPSGLTSAVPPSNVATTPRSEVANVTGPYRVPARWETASVTMMRVPPCCVGWR